jgi:hypothetical protein
VELRNDFLAKKFLPAQDRFLLNGHFTRLDFATFDVVPDRTNVIYIHPLCYTSRTAKRTHKANYLEEENGQWKMLGNFCMPEVLAK